MRIEVPIKVEVLDRPRNKTIDEIQLSLIRYGSCEVDGWAMKKLAGTNGNAIDVLKSYAEKYGWELIQDEAVRSRINVKPGVNWRVRPDREDEIPF